MKWKKKKWADRYIKQRKALRELRTFDLVPKQAIYGQCQVENFQENSENPFTAKPFDEVQKHMAKNVSHDDWQ